MTAAPLPADEAARLAELEGLGILDAAAVPGFDGLVELAARLLHVPIALVSLVDRDRQWFLSRLGLAATETPRSAAFCAHAILGDEMLVVPDAASDARFADNPLVTGAPNIRFYAGVPVHGPTGHRLGTLCAIDRTSRELDADQARTLRLLARQADELFRLWAESKENAALRAHADAASARMRRVLDAISDATFAVDHGGRIVWVNRAAEALLGVDESAVVGRPASEPSR